MRSFAGLLLSTGLVVAVAACGGKAASSPTTPPTGPVQPPDGEGAKPAEGQPGEAGGPGEAAKPEPAALDKAACKNRPDMFGPFALDEAQAKQRYGANARTYADAPTKKDRAVEVCGIPASRQWLKGTACADGSAAKQNGRVGSVGQGGRCGAIIDLYTVTCPEGEYEVFLDVYMCGPGESMR
jgi:hypothetical protein